MDTWQTVDHHEVFVAGAVIVIALLGTRRLSSQVPASIIKPGNPAQPPSLPTRERLLQDRVLWPHLEHVHHLPEI